MITDNARPRRVGRTKRRLVAGLSAVALPLALAACGGGGGGGEDDVIGIGLPHPLSGAWADGGQNAVNGALLAIEDVNAAGGIEALGGATLEGISADTSSTDAGQASSVTRRLIEEDGVSALVGAHVSAFSLTASTEAERGKVPMVSQSFTDELTERDYTYFFQLPPVATAIGASTVPYVQDAYAAAGIDIANVAVLASNDASIRTQGETAIQQIQDSGLNLVYDNFYQQDLTDASVIAREAASAEPDIIFLGGPTSAAATIMETLQSFGYEGPVLGLGGGGMLTPDFGNLLGDTVNGTLSLASWNWDLPYEGIEDVNERYMEKHDVPFMSHEAGQSYAAVWLIAEAMEQAGSSEPEDIAEVLRGIDISEGPGAWMPGNHVSFDETGRNEGVYTILIQWQDGVTRTVWPEDVATVEPL